MWRRVCPSLSAPSSPAARTQPACLLGLRLSRTLALQLPRSPGDTDQGSRGYRRGGLSAGPQSDPEGFSPKSGPGPVSGRERTPMTSPCTLCKGGRWQRRREGRAGFVWPVTALPTPCRWLCENQLGLVASGTHQGHCPRRSRETNWEQNYPTNIPRTGSKRTNPSRTDEYKRVSSRRPWLGHSSQKQGALAPPSLLEGRWSVRRPAPWPAERALAMA